MLVCLITTALPIVNIKHKLRTESTNKRRREGKKLGQWKQKKPFSLYSTCRLHAQMNRGGAEAEPFHKRLAILTVQKRENVYNENMAFLRRRLRFCILRGCLKAMRARGHRRKPDGLIRTFRRQAKRPVRPTDRIPKIVGQSVIPL